MVPRTTTSSKGRVGAKIEFQSMAHSCHVR